MANAPESESTTTDTGAGRTAANTTRVLAAIWALEAIRARVGADESLDAIIEVVKALEDEARFWRQADHMKHAGHVHGTYANADRSTKPL